MKIDISMILDYLKSGKSKNQTAKETLYPPIEVEKVIALLNEPGPYYDPKLYQEITAREERLEEERKREQNEKKEKIINMANEGKTLADVYAFFNDINKIRDLKSLFKHCGESKETYKNLILTFEKNKEKQEEIEKEKVIALLLKGCLYDKIVKEVGVSKGKIQNIVNSIQDKTLYDKIKQIHEEAVREGQKRAQVEDYRLARAREIINKKRSIIQIAFYYNYRPIKLINALKSIHDEQIQKALEPFYEDYEKKFGERKIDKRIREYPPKIQLDIIQTALTYRLSIKSLTILFDTTPEDCIAVLRSFETLTDSIEGLIRETNYEDEQNEKVSLYYAKEYWKTYNRLVKELNAAKKIKDQEKIASLEIELAKHHLLIDDQIVEQAKEKPMNRLTAEEKEKFARYRLKYYLTLKEGANRLHTNEESLHALEEELAEKNLIFTEKLTILNSYIKIFPEARKNRAIRASNWKDDSAIEPTKKELEEKKTLDYFNFTINPPTDTEDENVEMLRGGGTR